MPVTAPEVRQITQEIWSAILGLELVADGTDPAPTNGTRTVTGLVQITGAWTGAVGIELTDELARHATAIMFDLGDEEASDDDTRDAVGELANMTGGNVKSLLGAPAQLSLPSVTVGVDYRVVVPGAHVKEQVGFRCGDGRLVVTVLEQDGSRN